jgi:hypothetical protein
MASLCSCLCRHGLQLVGMASGAAVLAVLTAVHVGQRLPSSGAAGLATVTGNECLTVGENL